MSATRNRTLSLIIVALLGQTSQGRDPDPLTYADFGIYGRAVSPYYTSEPCPFNLVLLQWNATEAPDILNEQIKKTHEMGRKTILYCWFWKGSAEKDGPAPVPTVEDCVGRMERVLTSINHDHVYGVSLGEENSPSRERAQLLHDLYEALKKRYPNMRFFQWYTAGLGGWPNYSPVPGLGAPLVGADGWIVDEYYVRGVNFKRMMWKYRMLDVPFVCIVWAASGWQPYWKNQSAPDWADSQIDMLRRLNLAAGLFSVNQLSGPDGRTLGDLWAWEMDGLGPDVPRHKPQGVSAAPDPSRYYFNGDLYRDVGTDKRIYPPTRAKFDKYAKWAGEAPKRAAPPDVNDPELSFMGRKMPLKVELGKEGEENEGKFIYKDNLEGLIGREGSGGALLVRYADVDGALDLYYDGYTDDGGFKVRGAKGRPVRVTITYLIAGDQLFSNLKAKINGVYIEKLGGDLALSISLDGRHWTAGEKFRYRTDGDKWHGYLMADAAQHPALDSENYHQAYVRIEMINRSQADTDDATWLEQVEISVTKPD